MLRCSGNASLKIRLEIPQVSDGSYDWPHVLGGLFHPTNPAKAAIVIR